MHQLFLGCLLPIKAVIPNHDTLIDGMEPIDGALFAPVLYRLVSRI